MKVYILVILAITQLTLLYDYVNIDLKMNVVPHKIKSAKIILFVLMSLILISIAAFRFEVGTDYWQYKLNYERYVINVGQSIKEFNEPGIKIIAYISDLFHGGYRGMFLISSIITVGLSLFTIYESTDLMFVSALLYIFIGSWQGSFNGVRQFIAVAIIFFGHRYIIKKELLKYLLIVFLAASFHVSAFPMVFLYYVPQRKLTSKNIVFIVSIAILGLISSDIIFKLISFVIEAREDGFVETAYVLQNINILRIGVVIAPVLLYILVAKSNFYGNKDYFYINMLLINMAVFIVSYTSAYLNRFTLYTNIFTVLSIPSILKGFKRKDKYLLIFLIMMLYFVFWYIEVSGSQNLYNYKWIFGN